MLNGSVSKGSASGLRDPFAALAAFGIDEYTELQVVMWPN